jgi:hypothetical protein
MLRWEFTRSAETEALRNPDVVNARRMRRTDLTAQGPEAKSTAERFGPA